MKAYKIIPILMVLCMLVQGIAPALAVCEKPCCAENILKQEKQNPPLQAAVIPHQCCSTTEVKIHDSNKFHHSFKKIDAYNPINSSFVPVSLSYFSNNLIGDIKLHSSSPQCDCVEDQSDSASDQKAVSPGLIRVEKPQIFVFLQDSPAGVFSQKSCGDFLANSFQSTESGIVTPLYLKNLSLLI